MSESDARPDPNEHEIDPPPTPEEIELGRLAVEYVRRNPPRKEAEQ